MLLLALTASAGIAAAAPVPHEAIVDHRGTSYSLVYQPRLATRARTVGVAAGTRPSGERCRFEVTVTVERKLRRGETGQGGARLLPGARSFSDSRPGNCTQARRAIADFVAARADRIRAHVVEVAAADRAAVLADIDAAHALALN